MILIALLPIVVNKTTNFSAESLAEGSDDVFALALASAVTVANDIMQN